MLLFVISTIVPFALAGVAAWSELDRVAARSESARLHLLAKSVGMEVAGRIALADRTLQAEMALREPPRAQLGSSGPQDRLLADRLKRLTLFSGRVDVGPRGAVATSLSNAPPAADGQSTRGPGSSGSHLEFGRRFSVPGAPAGLSISRRWPDDSALVTAELSTDAIFEAIEDAGGDAALAVLLDDGSSVVSSEGSVPAAIPTLVRRSTGVPRSGPEVTEIVERGEVYQVALWQHPLRASFQGAPTLWVAVWRPAPSVWATIGSLQVVFPALMIAAVLLAVLLSSAQIRRQLRPLDALLAATQRLAARNFDSPVRIESGDEFEQLGHSFNSMAGSLQREFATVEAMSDVDRMLLESRGVETVLDALLPRICGVVGCWSATVLLLDRDVAGRARAFDFVVGMNEPMPVRRVAIDAASLALQFERLRSVDVEASALGEGNEFLGALVECGAVGFELCSLRRGPDFAGVLAFGWSAAAPRVRAAGAQLSHSLADRLSVALTSLAHGESLYREAHFDALTGLPNRRLFHQRVADALRTGKESDALGAVLFIDLDHFKRVNDTAGHGVGDQLLRRVAERLAACCPQGSTAARLGGDEFALLVPAASDEEAVVTLAERVLEALSDPIDVGRRELLVSASVGVAVFPVDGRSVDDLLKHADIAMYRAKESGRNRALFFEPAMNTRMQARVQVESGLHRALREQGFELAFQPIVSAAGMRLAGVEALLRWPQAPQGGLGPTQFIQIAEESGLIVDMGEWALDSALAAMASWQQDGLGFGYVSVNVSPRQLADEHFLRRVRGSFERHAVPPRQVLFEVTESVFADIAATRRALNGLAALGARIAIDDFGTGYSSLGYLRDLPIDAVKIDRSFITGVPLDEPSCRLVDTIVAMGHALGKVVIAEGVEGETQFEYLRQRGCDSIQGFYVARPMPGEAFQAWAQDWVRREPVAELGSAPQRAVSL
jgi:diguanylate cyclase